MNRRQLLQAGLGAGALGLAAPQALARSNRAPFRLGYAPHAGMFSQLGGNDVVAQIEYAHEQGFTA